MRLWIGICATFAGWMIAFASSVVAQSMQYPQSVGLPPTVLRDMNPSPSSIGGMVPLNPATQQGIYPSSGPNSTYFDPYNTRPSYQITLPSTAPPAYGSVAPYGNAAQAPTGMFGNPNGYSGQPYPMNGALPTTSLPSTGYPANNYPGGAYPNAAYPNAAYPNAAYPNSMTPNYPGGLSPGYPGVGASGPFGNYQGNAPGGYAANPYPNTAPPSLFPTSIFGNNQGGLFSGFTNWLGGTNPYGYGQGGYGQGGYGSGGFTPGAYGGPVNNAGVIAPGAIGSASPYGYNWNPQGSVAGAFTTTPAFVRFFQGPRFRHAYIYGDNDPNSLQINDSDLSLAFAVPNFLFSNQPLYILPSFSLHQWDGPNAPATADLPSKAYSAFLDSGWQSDPLRLLGAELGVRVGVFSDFNTFTSDSLRVMGRGLARVRITPTATLKGGVIYLDRNKVKLLPAAGVLWQPNPGTRFDLFFPEPKLAHYLNTVGTYDTWWYVGGYYGGGAWTVERTDGTKDSIDINDIRLMIGMEWGRNEQLRDGRRVGFLEAGYVFNRELLYKNTPADNLDLADSFVVRAGIGY